MAEDFGDKTEAPTPRRREESRREGNVARSPDLTSACVLLGVMVLLNFYGMQLVTALRGLLLDTLGPETFSQFSTSTALPSLARSLTVIGGAMAPIFVGVMLIAIAINMAQVGIYFNPQRLTPNLAALSPVRGLGRMFGGGQGSMRLVMGLLKLVLVAFVAYSAIHNRLGSIVGAQQLSFIQVFGLGAEIVYAITIRIGILLLVLAIIDYIWQRIRFERELRMTKQEVKEEMKQMDGDPHVKARRRQIMMQMARERLKKTVPTADVIVTNPTEFAVALKYDAKTMGAPRVVAKGQGTMAKRIREIAIENGIPILERKPLARALFRLVDVGQEIPEQFYQTVAEILAYVYELTGKMRKPVGGVRMVPSAGV